MTDLNERFAAMLDGEPTPPFDLDPVVARGRRALRRRNALVAVAGTAGTAAVTAAVVVPIAINSPGGGHDRVTVSTQPSPHPTCKAYYAKALNKHDIRTEVGRLRKSEDRKAARMGTTVTLTVKHLKHHVVVLGVCPTGATTSKDELGGAPTPAAPAGPPYSYSADPRTIADGFARELSKQVNGLGFTAIYTRPFAQETSTLDKGHPTYFDGGIDVQLPDGPANIGVQVTHEVTALVPFDDSCDPATCTRTKLPDGSVMEVGHLHSGSGGAEVITVEVHHPDGLVVEAQESNYGFGPEATKARSSQPLTIGQLTTLAEDPAWTF